MADDRFCEEQKQHYDDAHIAPINQYVDELRGRGRGWVPYVAPMYDGGVSARLLSVLRDPGPKTQENTGSGFLCMENDDPTAEKISGLFGDACIDARDIIPWNAYPWYINQKPKPDELRAGIEPLKHIIDLLPKLSVVMLHGGEARYVWERLLSHYPDIVAIRGLLVIKTYHTSRRAVRFCKPQERERREKHLSDSFHEAAERLKVTGP